MKRTVLMLILLAALALLAGQSTEPRSFLQPLVLDDGSVPRITFGEEKSAEEYLVRTWIVEKPEEVLNTDEHSTWHVNVTEAGDDIEYPRTVFLIIELGNFPSQWKVGETLYLEVTHKASGESVSWEVVIPEGDQPIYMLDTPQVIPPFTVDPDKAKDK